MSELPAYDETRLLTPGQRRLVGFALGFLALVASIALLVGVFIVLSFLVGHFSGVLWPIAVAGIMALIMRPLVEVIEKRLKMKRLGAVILLYGVFVLLVGGTLALIIPLLVEQILGLVAFLPTLREHVMTYVYSHYPHWVEIAKKQMENPAVKQVVSGFAEQSQSWLQQTLPTLKSAGLGALGIFGFITHLAVVPIYLFFFLLSNREPAKNLEKHLPFLKPEIRSDVVFLVHEFISIVVSFFRGQLVIGLIMGGMLSLGFTIVGLKFGIFIGLALGILNIVPYLGTIIGLSVAVPLALLQPEGGMHMLWSVLGVFALVQMIEGWYFTPKIMGNRTGLHPVVIIMAIFFWGTALNGILGMVLAIPLTAFFVTAWRLLKRKYWKTSAQS